MDVSPPQQLVSCADLLRSISDEWDKAEKDIKLAEQVSGKVVFPSIKELRYAGRRLVEVMKLMSSSGDIQEINAKLHEARFDCHRARHDAIDAGTAKISADLGIMVKKLGYDSILKMYPDFGQLHRDLNKIRKQIAASRNNTLARGAVYEELEQDSFPKIVEDFHSLQSCEDAIKGLARKERLGKAIVIVVGTIEFCVLVVAVLEHYSGIYNFLFNLYTTAISYLPQ